MKKVRLVVYLLTAALLPVVVGAQVVSSDNVHLAIVRIKTFSLGPDGFVTYDSSGTGVIIDPRGIILTNDHVISEKAAYDNSDFPAGYQVCLTTEVAKEPECTYTAMVIVKDENTDVALLQIVPISDLSSKTDFPYIQVSQTGAVNIGDEVRAVGYPGVGGDTISTTKGVVSGKQDKYGKSWIKTDAVVSFGSSGGALVNGDGKLVGVTSEVNSDFAASLGYAIDIQSVSPWISAYKNLVPTKSPIQDSVTGFTKKQYNRNASNTFQLDEAGLSITKPNGWEFAYESGDRLAIFNPGDDKAGYVQVAVGRNDFPVDFSRADLMVKTDILSGGVIAQANYVTNEITKLNNTSVKHVKVTGVPNPFEEYMIPNQDVTIQLLFGNGENDKDATSVKNILNSITVKSRPAPTPVHQYVNSKPLFSLKTNADWYVQKYNSTYAPLELFHSDFSSHVVWNVEKKTEDTRNLSNEDILKIKENIVENTIAASKNANLLISLESKDAHARLSDQFSDVVQFEIKGNKLSTGETLVYTYSVIVPTSNDYFMATLTYFGSSQAQFAAQVDSLKDSLASFSLSSTPATVSGPVVSTPIPNAQAVPAYSPITNSTSGPLPQVGLYNPAKRSDKLIARLRGSILLQTESHGEAWYLNPMTGLRYYMSDGNVAYAMMRSFGLGIADSDLGKIPAVEDSAGMVNASSVCSMSSTANRLRGRILLQVQQHGEAWYIHPATCRRIYLKDGAAAYSIMRFLSLGISNSDLEKLPDGSL